MNNLFSKRHYEALVQLLLKIKNETVSNKHPTIELKALEDHISMFLAKNNNRFDIVKFRKALGRSDIGTK